MQDKEEKQFIYRHSRTVFELLDEDGSQSISAEEFSAFGFLFNFQADAVKQIFDDFDISGDQVKMSRPMLVGLDSLHEIIRFMRLCSETIIVLVGFSFSK